MSSNKMDEQEERWEKRNKEKEEIPTEGAAPVPEPSKTTEASSGTPITHAEDAGENKNGDTPFPASVHISDAKSENSQNIQNGEKRKKPCSLQPPLV